MSYRSEQNKIANKQNYKDLTLSQYPNALDTRANNTNMRGFINVGEGEIPDYVMAEYVNAAMDGIMAIERTLGVAPMVPYDTPTGNINTVIENSTVNDRLARIEDGLFDERYGGSGWKYVGNRPTLSKHQHNGQNGHPSKIHLQTDVQSVIRKANIDLTLNTGLLGSDIFVSKQNAIKIDEAIADSLSKSAGGTVTAPVDFKSRFSSRTRMDFVASELTVGTGVTLISDAQASDGRAVRYGSTSTTLAMVRIPSALKAHLLYGKYVMGVRMKSSLSNASSLLRVQLGAQVQTIKANEIGTSYKQVYFVFDHTSATKGQDLTIEKLATTSNTMVTIDSIIIEPIHPAVLDR